MDEARSYVGFMTESFEKMRPSDDFVLSVMHKVKHAPKTSLLAGTDVAPKRWRSGAEGVPGWRGSVLRLFMCWTPESPPQKRFGQFMKVAAVLAVCFFLIAYACLLNAQDEPYRPDGYVRQQQPALGSISLLLTYGRDNNLARLLTGDENADYYLELHVDSSNPGQWYAITMPKVHGVTGDFAYYVDSRNVVSYTEDGTVPNANSPRLNR